MSVALPKEPAICSVCREELRVRIMLRGTGQVSAHAYCPHEKDAKHTAEANSGWKAAEPWVLY